MKTSSTNRTFNLCFLLAFGLAFWPVAVRASTPIACGQTIASNTGTATEIDVYTYAGTAGQVVSFVFNWSGNDYCNNAGEMDIYYPGASLAGPPSTNVTSDCSGNQLILTLPSSGTYYLLVHEQGYNGIGSYQLSVQSITGGGCNPTPISCGQTLLSNVTSYATESDPYHFVGTNGQVVSFVFNWSGNDYCNNAGEMDIYYPGSTVPATNVTADCSGTNIDLTLPSSGTYMLLVHEQGYNGIGSYQLSAQSITGGGCNPTPISCGQTPSSNITYAVESDPWHFAGTAGQVVSFVFNWSGNDYCNNAGEMDIYYPGSTVPATNVTADCSGTNIDLTLPTSGTYTLLVHERGYNGIGSYQLNVQSITEPCNLTPIGCGQTLSASINYATEIDPYNFAGPSGQVVFFTFNWSGNDYCNNTGEMDIYYPGSTVPATNVTADCSGTEVSLMLPTCGTYTLLVYEQGYNGGGSYSITATCPEGGCSNMISTSSSPSNGGSTSGGGTYNCCSTVTLCATPSDCYNFTNWTLNDTVVSTSICYTFTATSDGTLTANFTPTAGRTNQICGFQVAGTNVAVSVQSVEGDTYQLQSRNSMTAGSWANVSGVVLSNSAGGLIILTNSGGASTTQRFFRVDCTAP
ncbi:MAG: InlB B-repeat-containing protein [Verrucomicrobiia bacterium]